MRNSSSTRYSRKSANVQNKSDSSSPETSKNKNRANSPNPRQKRGPLGPDVKAKRHEIKSDPTPFGFEEVFGKSLLVQSECKNSNNSTATRQVPRSTSQTGWPSRQFPSLDTYEDFETIPSSNDELSNSSDLDEEIHTNNGASLFRVNGSFDACYPDSFTLQHGDLVQFIQGGENAQWLVKEMVSQKTVWVPSSLLYPAEGNSNNSSRDKKTDHCRDTGKSSLPAASGVKDLKKEVTKGSTKHQSVVS